MVDTIPTDMPPARPTGRRWLVGPATRHAERVSSNTYTRHGVAFSTPDPRVSVVVSGDRVLLFDGRLDDHQIEPVEARAVDCETQQAGARPAHALRFLKLHQQRGEACIDRLRGDFVAVVFEPGRLRLTVLRDVTGMRPAYVSDSPEGPIVAGTLKDALDLLPAARPDPLWVAGFFVGAQLDAETSPYVGLSSVVPGHVAVHDNKRPWQQHRVATWQADRLRDQRLGAYDGLFRDRLDTAVRRRVEEDAAAGVALSGGIDSASLAATAAAVAPDVAWHALCLPFDDVRGDERQLQQEIAAEVGAELHWVNLTGSGPFGRGEPEAVYERFGAVPLTLNWFMQDALAKAAAELGLTKCFAGEDADSALGGAALTHTTDLLATLRWGEWKREVVWLRLLGISGYRDTLHKDLRLLTPPAVRRRMPSVFGRHTPPGLLSSEMMRALDLEERLSRAWSVSVWSWGRAFALAQSAVSRPEYVQVFGNDISRPWQERGIELCLPYLDRDLVSLTMGLPAEHVVHRGINKIVLRRSQAGRLPSHLRAQRTKADLGQPSESALAGSQAESLRRGLQAALRRDDWFSADYVRQLSEYASQGARLAHAGNVARLALWLDWVDARAQPG